MPYYLISYELNTSGKDYGKLMAFLASHEPSWHHLDSTWIVHSHLSAAQVRDQLRRHLSPTDALFVVDIAGRPMAWTGISEEGSAWVKTHLKAT
jgi:hypothetical protein